MLTQCQVCGDNADDDDEVDIKRWRLITLYLIHYISPDSICGPANINLSNTFLLNVTAPGNRLVECAWVVTGPPGTMTFLDIYIVNADEKIGQRVALGRGHDIGNVSSLVDGIEYLDQGMSYFLFNTQIWITIESSEYTQSAMTLEMLLRSENHTQEKGIH